MRLQVSDSCCSAPTDVCLRHRLDERDGRLCATWRKFPACGVGTGIGTGVGSRRGPGLGSGSGGGTAGGVYRPGGTVSAPRLRKEVKPRYTKEALLNGIQGSVVLEVLVTDDGCASQIRIVQSLDAGGSIRKPWPLLPNGGSNLDVLGPCRSPCSSRSCSTSPFAEKLIEFNSQRRQFHHRDSEASNRARSPRWASEPLPTRQAHYASSQQPHCRRLWNRA